MQKPSEWHKNILSASGAGGIFAGLITGMGIILAFTYVFFPSDTCVLLSNCTTTSSTSSSSSSSSTSYTSITTTFSGSDYNFFVQPNLANIEAVRSYLMTNYNSQYGMIQTGNFPNTCKSGNGLTICPNVTQCMNAGQANCSTACLGFSGQGTCLTSSRTSMVLINNNLMIGAPLDYLNSLKGISTHILQNVRTYLGQSFIDPTGPGGTYSYNGQDRREVFLGHRVTCIYQGGTQIFYLPANNYNQPNPITTELPGLASQGDYSSSCDTSTGPQSLEQFSAVVLNTFMNGNIALAQSEFQQSVNAWTGSSFGSSFDPASGGGSATMRALAEWLIMARGTGFWINYPSQATQIMNLLWSDVHNSQVFGGGGGFAPETGGEVVLAFDPRLPSWFNGSGQNGG